MLERVIRLARTGFPVLLEGESGTGKSYFAELLHAESPRASAPFQVIDLAALEEGLATSELFGHAKGAFTGANSRRCGLLASANAGTVFLDEIGRATPGIQAKLLRVLERREVRSLGEDRLVSLDVRFVAATSEPLDRLVLQGRFLQDLRFRLQGHRVVVPPLRDRRADIPELVQHFARLRAAECGYVDGPPGFESKVMRALVAAPWPGNLRQLDQAVAALMTEADGDDRVTCKHFCHDLEYLLEFATDDDSRCLADIQVALAQANDNRSEAARLLSMPRSTFYRRLRDLGLQRDEAGPNAAHDTGDSTV